MKKYIKAILLLSTLILIAACGKTTYELDGDITVEFEGYDEYGTAIVSIDKSTTYNNLSAAMQLKDPREVVELDSVISSLEVEAVPNENLKNDEEIELKLKYNEDNQLDVVFELNESKITVQNLEPIKTLSQEDIFSPVEIQFEGVSPFLEARIVEDASNEVASLFTYTISSDDHYKIDDEVQIIAEPKSDLLQSGFEANENDFTLAVKVPDQRKYVASWVELNEEDQNYLLDEVNDVVTARVDSKIQDTFYSIHEKGRYVTNGRSISESSGSEIDETYFLFTKKFERGLFGYYDDVNRVHFIFNNQVTFGDANSSHDLYNQTRDYYSVVEASNLIIDENGHLERNAVEITTYIRSDLDKQTVTNETINQNKDKYNVDQFELNE